VKSGPNLRQVDLEAQGFRSKTCCGAARLIADLHVQGDLTGILEDVERDRDVELSFDHGELVGQALDAEFMARWKVVVVDKHAVRSVDFDAEVGESLEGWEVHRRGVLQPTRLGR